MKRLELADLRAVPDDLGGDLEDAASRVLRSGRYVGGPEVSAFEQSFAEYLGARHAVAVANGTDALILALLATGVGPGSEVLVPTNTFIATAEAVVAAGAAPRFIDVERDSGLLDLRSAGERVTDRTKAIIPVHLYGRMAPMDDVLRFADEHRLTVIEDAAQAHGAHSHGRSAGTIAIVGCFSFFPGKNLGAVGDAGAVVTGDDEIADRLRLLRDHGRRGRDEHLVVGRNSRMDALQAAVLSAKLPHLDRWTLARRAVAERYRTELGSMIDWQPPEPELEVHHIFPVLVEARDDVQTRLLEVGIVTGVHYRRALSTIDAFGSPDRCPVAEWRASRQLSLPIHPYLSDADVDRVIESVSACAYSPATS
jgi:dTDP-4-amino-4,6-dideoxygalactose transaminase